ncbi:hypothetical protein BD310DRAFT_920688, partial [Dichomitus squalens]
MGFEGLWATRTLAPYKRPDKSQLASAEQASTDPSRERYGISNTLTYPQRAKILWVFRVYGLPGVWVRRVST